MAITRSTFHRTVITRKHCCIWLSLPYLLFAIALKRSFIAQLDSVECAFHFKHGVTLVLIILVLFVLCTVSLVAVFLATWYQLPRAARAIPVPTVRAEDQPINPAEIEYVPLRDLLQPTAAASPVVEEKATRSSAFRTTTDKTTNTPTMVVHASETT